MRITANINGNDYPVNWLGPNDPTDEDLSAIEQQIRVHYNLPTPKQPESLNTGNRTPTQVNVSNAPLPRTGQSSGNLTPFTPPALDMPQLPGVQSNPVPVPTNNAVVPSSAGQDIGSILGKAIAPQVNQLSSPFAMPMLPGQGLSPPATQGNPLNTPSLVAPEQAAIADQQNTKATAGIDPRLVQGMQEYDKAHANIYPNGQDNPNRPLYKAMLDQHLRMSDMNFDPVQLAAAIRSKNKQLPMKGGEDTVDTSMAAQQAAKIMGVSKSDLMNPASAAYKAFSKMFVSSLGATPDTLQGELQNAGVTGYSAKAIQEAPGMATDNGFITYMRAIQHAGGLGSFARTLGQVAAGTDQTEDELAHDDNFWQGVSKIGAMAGDLGTFAGAGSAGSVIAKKLPGALAEKLAGQLAESGAEGVAPSFLKNAGGVAAFQGSLMVPHILVGAKDLAQEKGISYLDALKQTAGDQIGSLVNSLNPAQALDPNIPWDQKVNNLVMQAMVGLGIIGKVASGIPESDARIDKYAENADHTGIPTKAEGFQQHAPEGLNVTSVTPEGKPIARVQAIGKEVAPPESNESPTIVHPEQPKPEQPKPERIPIAMDKLPGEAAQETAIDRPGDYRSRLREVDRDALTDPFAEHNPEVIGPLVKTLVDGAHHVGSEIDPEDALILAKQLDRIEQVRGISTDEIEEALQGLKSGKVKPPDTTGWTPQEIQQYQEAKNQAARMAQDNMFTYVKRTPDGKLYTQGRVSMVNPYGISPIVDHDLFHYAMANAEDDYPMIKIRDWKNNRSDPRPFMRRQSEWIEREQHNPETQYNNENGKVESGLSKSSMVPAKIVRAYMEKLRTIIANAKDANGNPLHLTTPELDKATKYYDEYLKQKADASAKPEPVAEVKPSGNNREVAPTRVSREVPESAAPTNPVEPKPEPAQSKEPAVKQALDLTNRTGIANRISEQRVASGDLAELTKRASPGDKASFEAGASAVESGKINPEELAKELAVSDRPGSNVEVGAMIEGMRRLEVERNEAKARVEHLIESGGHESELFDARARYAAAKFRLDEYANNVEKTKGTASATLRAYAAATKLDFSSYDDVLRTTRRILGKKSDEPLSKGLTKALQEQVDANKDLHSKLDASNAELERLKAQSTLDQSATRSQTRNTSTRRVARDAGALKAEREAILADLQKAIGKTSANPFLDPEILRPLSKLAKNYIESGVGTLEDLVAKMREHMPGASDTDIHRAISYTEPVAKNSASELTKKIAEIRAAAKQSEILLDKLDREQAQKVAGEARSLGSIKPPKPVDPTVAKLRSDLKSIRETMKRAVTPKDIESARIKIASIQKELESGKFDQKTSTNPGRESNPNFNALQQELKSLKAQKAEIQKRGDFFVKLQSKIDALEAKIKSGDYSKDEPKEKVEKVVPQEINDARNQVKHLSKIVELNEKLSSLQEQIKTGNIEPPKSREIKKVEDDIALLNHKIKQSQATIKNIMARGSGESGFAQKIGNFARANVLSGIPTLAKLSAAAASRIAASPVEELIGSALKNTEASKLAPRHGGGLNLEAEKASIKRVFSKQTLDDMKNKFLHGANSLDMEYGTDGPHHFWYDLLTNIHGALKTPAQVAEFERSVVKRTNFAIKNGEDISNPYVKTMIGAKAYLDSREAILLGPNKLAEGYSSYQRSLENSDSAFARATGTIMRALNPVVRVPANYVGESLRHALGILEGGIDAGVHKKSQFDDKRNGVAPRDMTEKQAENIMRAYKKGGLGAALFTLFYINPGNVFQSGGYYDPTTHGKPDDNGLKPGELRIAGVKVPHNLDHSPLAEIAHMAHTIRHWVDKTGDTTQGFEKGLGRVAVGIMDETPVVSEATRLARDAKNKPASQFGAQIATNALVPLGIRQGAQALDDLHRNQRLDAEVAAGKRGKEQADSMKEDSVKRKPQSAMDVLKLAVPFLREQVSE